MSARPMNTADALISLYPTESGERNPYAVIQFNPLPSMRAPRPNIASLLARAERAILAREQAIARFKAACACSLVGLDFVLLKGLRERRVDRCARLVRESYAEIAALVQAWRELYEKVSGGSR